MFQLIGTGLLMADGYLDSVHAQQREDNSKILCLSITLWTFLDWRYAWQYALLAC
jgi:hypothetical protein